LSGFCVNDKIAVAMEGQTIETKGNIIEKETRNPIIKAVNKVFGISLESEFLVPDNLNYEVERQPSGAKIFLKGPRENLQALCQTPNFTVSFGEIACPGTIFVMQKSKRLSFEANDEKKKVFIPSNLGLLRRDFAFGITHEMSHLWENQDEDWLRIQNNAKNLLGTKLLSDLPGESLSKNPEERQREKNAWRVLGKSETRATEIALYIIGKLRFSNVDILPQCPDIQSLLSLVNPLLRFHEQFDQRLILSYKQVEDLIKGNLPYPALKEKIDDRIASSLLRGKHTS
jgi:hypothetical protein